MKNIEIQTVSHPTQTIEIHHTLTPSSELERETPDEKFAKHWLAQTTRALETHLTELTDMGAPGATDDEFFGPHKAFLSLVEEKLEAHDPSFVDMFSTLEREAHEHMITGDLSVSKENAAKRYDRYHLMQLDFFGTMVDEGQYRADADVPQANPHAHAVDYATMTSR